MVTSSFQEGRLFQTSNMLNPWLCHHSLNYSVLPGPTRNQALAWIHWRPTAPSPLNSIHSLKKQGAEPSNTKRASEGQGSVSGTKKLKTTQRPGSYIEAPAGAIFPSDQIPATLAYQHAAVSDSQLQLVVTVGPRAFLVNNSASPVLLRAGAIICGFYKGKWWVQRRDKEGKASQEASEKDIQFTLKQFWLRHPWYLLHYAFRSCSCKESSRTCRWARRLPRIDWWAHSSWHKSIQVGPGRLAPTILQARWFSWIRPFIVTKVSVTCPPHMALELTASADEVDSSKEEVKNEWAILLSRSCCLPMRLVSRKNKHLQCQGNCLNDLFAFIFVRTLTCQLGDGTKSAPGNNIILEAVVVGSELSDDGQRRLARYCQVVSKPKRRSQQKKCQTDWMDIWDTNCLRFEVRVRHADKLLNCFLTIQLLLCESHFLSRDLDTQT